MNLAFDAVEDALRMIPSLERKFSGSRSRMEMGVCDDEIAEKVGVTPHTVVRWRRDGVPVPKGDELACALGFRPQELWPDFDLLFDSWAMNGTGRRLRVPALDGWSPFPEPEPGGTFCGRPETYRVPAHRCAKDGCRCGRRKRRR